MSDYFLDIAGQADRQRAQEAVQTSFEAENREHERQRAAERETMVRKGYEAHRLLQDQGLWNFLKELRDGFADLAITHDDPKERERNRLLARAIDHLYAEMDSRMQTAHNINVAALTAHAHE